MPLCRLSNDFLLPTMITFLNDRDWQTRAAFFRDVSCIASQAGFSGMEAFLLPCVEQACPLLESSSTRPPSCSLQSVQPLFFLEPGDGLERQSAGHTSLKSEWHAAVAQALADESETVIAEAIGFLKRVVEGRHMRKRSLLAATARVVAKLQHSGSTAVRAAASDFIAAAARSLSPAETYALLTPLVMPAMASEPVLMMETHSVSACLRQGGSRALLNLPACVLTCCLFGHLSAEVMSSIHDACMRGLSGGACAKVSRCCCACSI